MSFAGVKFSTFCEHIDESTVGDDVQMRIDRRESRPLFNLASRLGKPIMLMGITHVESNLCYNGTVKKNS